MTQEKYTTKGRKFKHLTSEKRAQIEVLLRQGVQKIQIAKIMGISRSTLYREIERGTAEQIDTNLKRYRKYFWDVGQRVYEENRKNSRPPMKLMDAYSSVAYAENQILENKMSPDALCGEAKISGQFETIVCTKTLYNYIDKCLLQVRNIDLPLKVRRKCNVDKGKTNKRILGESIEQRPAEVNARAVFGHWEIDTIVGKKENSPVLLSLDERMTRKRHLIKISSRSSKAVREALLQLAKLYGDTFENVFQSITCDNGSEFANLSDYLPATTKVYYAHPYSSYERGTNERQNGLVRRFFKKGKSFDDVTDEQVAFVERWINNLPRKIFNYQSADFVFQSVLFDVAI